MSKIIDILRKNYLISKLTRDKRIEIDNNMQLSSESKNIVKYEQLENYLQSKKIPEKYYSIGNDKEDSICINFISKWLVYYSERGEKKVFLESFNEEEACQLFLLIVKKSIATDTGREEIFLYEKL